MSEDNKNQDQDQNKNQNWFDALPDDVKSNESFVQWKDKEPKDVLQAYADLQGRAIVAPKPEAPKEEVDAFDKKMRELLGVPEKIEDYKLTLPEGVSADDPLIMAIVKEGHAKGVNAKQVQAIITEGAKALVAARQAEIVQAKTALGNEWKSNYQSNLEASINTMRLVAIEAGIKEEDAVKMLDTTGLKDDPVMIRMYHVVSRHYAEDKSKGGSGAGEGVAKIRYDKHGIPIIDDYAYMKGK